MINSRILAFSSSKVGNGNYLQAALPVIQQFLGATNLNIAFIPFAGVTVSYQAYTDNVCNALLPLGCTIHTVLPENASEIITNADVIMTGGGNTFKLLAKIYEANVLKLIQQKIQTGTPYIGWSAGSNILGPTICTTNDMPIVEPKSFKALQMFPFQINPHYLKRKHL
jgi:dipeptidase E